MRLHPLLKDRLRRWASVRIARLPHTANWIFWCGITIGVVWLYYQLFIVYYLEDFK